MDLSQLDPEQFERFIPAPTTWWEVLLALLSVLASWLISHYARDGIFALSKRTPGISKHLWLVVARLVQYLVILLGIGVALAFLGANVQPLLAIVLIVVAVLVMVIRGFAENFAASVLIQWRQPVRLGEEIQVEGPDGAVEGVIKELNGRSVIITTVDGRTMHIPNATLLGEVLVNHSRQGARRSEVQVRIDRSVKQDLEHVLALLERAASTVTGDADDLSPPRTLVQAVSPERWTIRVQFWHHPLNGPGTTAAVVAALADTLAQAGLVSTVTAVPGIPPFIPPDIV